MGPILVRTLFGLAVGAFVSGCASSSWLRRRPPADSEFKYYVGRSFKANSAEDGLAAARANAKIQAIEENFGTQVKYQRDSNESMDDAQVIDRSRTISRNIQLNGFEELEVQQHEVDDSEFETAILFRYSKKDIKAEKARLARVQSTEEEINFEPIDIPLKEKILKDRRAIQATLIVGLGAGGQFTSSIGGVDNSSLNGRLQLEWRIAKARGLSFAYEHGENATHYSNGDLIMKKSALSVGMPLYGSSVDRSAWTTYIEPAAQLVGSQFSFSNSSGSESSGNIKWQAGPALNIGARFRFYAGDESGFSIRPSVGVFYPLTKSEFSNEPAYQAGLVFQWEFFDK